MLRSFFYRTDKGFRVLYREGERSIPMTEWDARSYANIFGARVEEIPTVRRTYGLTLFSHFLTYVIIATIAIFLFQLLYR